MSKVRRAGPQKKTRQKRRALDPIQSVAYHVLIYAAFTGLFAVLGVLVMDRYIMPELVRRGDEIEIPDVTGQDYSVAIRMLRDEGFDPRRLGEDAHPSAPRDIVLSQEPVGGSVGKPSRPVYLVVSSGPARTTVPELAGLGCREAINILTTADFQIGDLIMLESARLSVGQVLATAPSAGTPVLGGGAVDLLVAGPPEYSCYLMPKIDGASAGGVLRAFKKKGIEISSRSYVQGSGRPVGTVLSVLPEPGFRVCTGESIAVVLSAS